jgi:phospholipase C
MRPRPLLALVVLACAVLAPTAAASSGIHKIKHIVVIMQENRSFDSYFGTYPGADGIPMRHGRITVCVPDPLRKKCVRPYHDPHDTNLGGPHEHIAFTTDLDGGKLDGFIRARQSCKNALDPPDCVATRRPT